jgi:hypothetical protein
VWAILAVFWLFGAAVSVWAGTNRTVRVDVTDSGALLVTHRSPFRAERRRIDPYFTSRVTLADGATVDLAESHDQAAMEATTKRFNAVAGRRRSPSQRTPP